MKLRTLLALLAISASTLLKAEVLELTTIGGKTYHDCRILKVDPDGVLFRHSSGAGKVLFKDMTRSMRDHFGYDAEKAKAHEEKVATERKKTREVAMKQAYEAAKQQQEAINRQAENQALVAIQNAFSQNNNASMTNGWIALSGGLPLGQSYDGRGYVRGDQYGCGSTVMQRLSCNARGVVEGRVGFSQSNQFGAGSVTARNRLPITNGRYFNTGCNTSACNTNYFNNTLCTGFTPRPFFAVPGVGINVAPQTCAPVMHGSSSGVVVFRR
jgi:Skp family chaperone for outer membrane proteins